MPPTAAPTTITPFTLIRSGCPEQAAGVRWGIRGHARDGEVLDLTVESRLRTARAGARAENRTTRSIRARLLLVGSVALLAACGPAPSARPREGAPVVIEGEPVRKVETLAPNPVPTPSPALADLPFSPPERRSPNGVLPIAASPSPLPSPSPSPDHVIVATDGAGANLRTGPSTASSVIATLREGTPVEPLGDPVSAEGRSWRHIRTVSGEGWVVSVVVRPR